MTGHCCRRRHEIGQQCADARIGQIYPGTGKVMKFTVE